MHIIHRHTCNMRTPSMTNMRITKSHPQENNHGIHIKWSVSAKVCRAQKPEITDLQTMPVNLSSVVWRSLLLSSRWYLRPWAHVSGLGHTYTAFSHGDHLHSWSIWGHQTIRILLSPTPFLTDFWPEHHVILCWLVEQRLLFLALSSTSFLLTTRWYCSLCLQVE